MGAAAMILRARATGRFSFFPPGSGSYANVNFDFPSFRFLGGRPCGRVVRGVRVHERVARRGTSSWVPAVRRIQRVRSQQHEDEFVGKIPLLAIPAGRRAVVVSRSRPHNEGRMDPLEPRVVDLELRFMKLEREVAELSQVVAAQQQVIEALTLEAKRRRESDAMAQEPVIPDEKPPHY
jgi:uncharacterized coiled-coil protein SlyX